MTVQLITECRIRPAKRSVLNERFDRVIARRDAGEPRRTEPVNPGENSKLRVLIVDDSAANVDTLAMLVAQWGHEVRRAYDGVTGLALAAAYQPHVLLLDMLMPVLSGFDVAIQVRRQDRLEKCFIIAVTGRTDATHRDRCYTACVDLFLIKPVAPTDLRALLSLEAERVKRIERVVTAVNMGSGLEMKLMN